VVSYSITFDKSKEIVHVVYAGVVSLNDRMQAVQDVCDSYSEFAPLKILVNVRELIMHLSFDEQEYFGRYLANHEGLAQARVAVLHGADHNPNMIVDSSAFVNGYMLAPFNDRKDAESWLLKT
jgi:hypothetical protein